MRRCKVWRIIGLILVAVVAFFLVINLIPPSKVVEENPFLVEKGALPMVAAHRRNMAVQYWTINDPDEMRMLIDLGCDCIMTDNPKLLQQILDEYR